MRVFVRGRLSTFSLTTTAGKAASMLKSLDLYNPEKSKITIREDSLLPFSLLETLIWEPMTIKISFNFRIDKRSPQLITLGWRITGHADYHPLLRTVAYFQLRRFPNLQAVYIVYPRDVQKSPIADTLRRLFSIIGNHWIPIFTLNNQLLCSDTLSIAPQG